MKFIRLLSAFLFIVIAFGIAGRIDHDEAVAASSRNVTNLASGK